MGLSRFKTPNIKLNFEIRFSLKPVFIPFYDDLSILFEHNSKGINTGFKLNLISKFNLMFGVWNLDKPTFAFNYFF